MDHARPYHELVGFVPYLSRQSKEVQQLRGCLAGVPIWQSNTARRNRHGVKRGANYKGGRSFELRVLLELCMAQHRLLGEGA